MLKRSIILLSAAFLVMWSASCSQKTAPKAKAEYDGPMVSYASQIAPVIERSCSPCHFPAKEGKVERLDNYESLKHEISEVITRVQLPGEDVKFMPYKHKKESLSDSEIELLKNWAKGGFPE